MRLRIYSATFLVALVMTVSATDAADPPCSAQLCSQRLTARERVARWRVTGHAGGHWLLFLNIYSGGRRLSYERLPGGCDASYSSAYLSAVLHACGHCSVLEYVSYRGARTFRVEFRYTRR